MPDALCSGASYLSSQLQQLLKVAKRLAERSLLGAVGLRQVRSLISGDMVLGS